MRVLDALKTRQESNVSNSQNENCESEPPLENPLAASTPHIPIAPPDTSSSPPNRREDSTPPYVALKTTLNLAAECMALELPSLHSTAFTVQSCVEELWSTVLQQPDVTEKPDDDAMLRRL